MSTPTKRGALLLYGAAVMAVAIGVIMAASRFPGGYDWAYTVISRLASNRQNPEGGRWLAASLLVAVVLLWPVANHFAWRFSQGGAMPRLAVGVLRVGLVGGALLAFEGLLNLQLSRQLEKAHEALALATFLGFYGGVLGLYAHRVREALSFVAPALLVILPLCAVGITQLMLYIGQRDLGWVDTNWREFGVPLWLSFAFWQWLAVVFLALGIGYLIAAGGHGGQHPSRRHEAAWGSASPSG